MPTDRNFNTTDTDKYFRLPGLGLELGRGVVTVADNNQVVGIFLNGAGITAVDSNAGAANVQVEINVRDVKDSFAIRSFLLSTKVSNQKHAIQTLLFSSLALKTVSCPSSLVPSFLFSKETARQPVCFACRGHEFLIK